MTKLTLLAVISRLFLTSRQYLVRVLLINIDIPRVQLISVLFDDQLGGFGNAANILDELWPESLEVSMGELSTT
jgi:hypothetical protein